MSEEFGFSLRDTVNVIYRRIYILKIIVLVLPLSVWVWSLSVTPVYESTAKIIVTAKKESATLLQVPKEAGSSAIVNLNVDETDLNSEVELLQSLDLWTRTVKKLGSARLKEKDGGLIAEHVRSLTASLNNFLGLEKDSSAAGENKQTSELVETARALMKRLKVVPVPKSKVLDVSFRYSNPVMAKTILSVLLEEYVPYHLEVYAVPGAENFFSGQGDLYKQKYEKAEQELTQFKKQWGIASPEKQKTELISLLKQIDDSLVELNANLSQYDNMLAALNQNAFPTGQLAPSLQRGNENTVVNVIATQLLRAKQQQLQAVQQFAPESRDYRQAGELVEALTKKFRQAIQSEQDVLKAKKVSLVASRASKEAQLQLLEEKSEELRKLQLAAAISKERYVQYGTKEEEARMESLKGGNKLVDVSVVGQPFTPAEPVFPKTKLFVLGSLLLAFPVGLGLILVANFLDATLDSPREVEAATGLPVLASIQKLKKKTSRY